MLKRKSVTNNLLYSILYQVITVLAPIITTPYISRVLGPERIGEYSYALSITTYFGLLGILGSSTYGQILISKDRYDGKKLSVDISSILVIRKITFSLSTVLYIVLIAMSSEYKVLYILLLTYIIGQYLDVNWFYQGLEDFRTTAIKNAIIKLVSIIFIFGAVRTENDLQLYIIIQQGAVVAVNTPLFYRMKKYVCKENIDTDDIKRKFKIIIVYFIPTIATMIFVSMDKSMIGWITQSPLQNGYYEQANKISAILISFVTALTTVVLSRMSIVWKEEDVEEARRMVDISIRYILMIVLPLAAGVFIISDELVNQFLGMAFEGSSPILKVFCIMIFFTCINSIVSNSCMVANNKQGKLNAMLVVSSIINLVLNILLITRYEALGASIASVVSEGILFVMIFMYNKKYFNLKSISKSLVLYFSLTILMSVVLYAVKNGVCGDLFRIIICSVLGTVIYFGGLIILKDELIVQFTKNIMIWKRK